MERGLNAFKINVNGKILDYRVGQKLDLVKVTNFFNTRYRVKKIWSGGRHILGILEKSHRKYFLKLSTSEGISAVTNHEHKWNEIFNQQFPGSKFRVPQNFDNGYFNDKLFYLITEKFEGKLLCNLDEPKSKSNQLIDDIEQVVELSKLIEEMQINDLKLPDYIESENFKDRFISKAKAWYEAIPKDISKKFRIITLLKLVENGVLSLEKKPRHGDFTPWHIFRLTNNQLGLIDGEHAISGGVEGYDIGYFIQRIFSVLKNPQVVERILIYLIDRGYKLSRIKVVLAARAIGGYLDESLASSPNYEYAKFFQEWVISL